MGALVLDIQRFSLHDGPGIRTTVFLKGCPLHCAWCCNPESQSPGPTLAFDASKCHTCGECVKACSKGVLSVDDHLHLSRDRCDGCEDCIFSCPHQALSIYGYVASPEDVFREVLADRAYYEASGGGLTVSGGECTMHPEWTLDLLRMAKSEGIHTCVETSGFGPSSHFQDMAPWVDLWLFDFKASDPVLHQRYTGKSNALILHNLHLLNDLGACITLRCPIIEGINDTSQHFDAIADLFHWLHHVQDVELMPYHDWGVHKYKQIGWDEPVLCTRATSPELHREWQEQMIVRGCQLTNGHD